MDIDKIAEIFRFMAMLTLAITWIVVAIAVYLESKKKDRPTFTGDAEHDMACLKRELEESKRYRPWWKWFA